MYRPTFVTFWVKRRYGDQKKSDRNKPDPNELHHICKACQSHSFLVSSLYCTFINSENIYVLVRPPDILVGGQVLPRFFFYLFPPATLWARWPRSSTKNGHMRGSECDLKMYVRNLWYPLRLHIGCPKPPFSTTSQLNGKFHGLYSKRNKLYISERARWKLQGASYRPTSSQNDINFGPQQA